MSEQELVINLLKGDKVDTTVEYRDALPVNVSGVARQILGAAGYMRQEPGLTEYGNLSNVTRYVTFDRSAYMIRNAELTGAADSKVGTVACRIRFNSASDGIHQSIISYTGGNFAFYKFTDNKIYIFAKNSANVGIFNNPTSVAYTGASGWLNILISFDMTGSIAQMYVNDISVADTAVLFTNDTIDYTRTNTAIGAEVSTNNPLDADVDFIWQDQTVAIDFSVTANRRKFFDAQGLPADLGSDGSTPTGTAPIIYVADGVPATFITNKGTGGGFTLTGTLTGGTYNIGGTDRGGVWNEEQEKLFRVSGQNLITLDADGVTAVLGTISGSGQASLPYSFNTQAVIANGKYWLYDASNGFREVIDVDLGSPIDCVWVDGYYFFTDGSNLYHTDIADESSINPLKFATSEYSPDPTLGVGLTTDNKVMAFNRYTTEYFTNEANANFAFTRLPSRNVEIGIVATHAKTKINGDWYIMGGSKSGDISIFAVGVGTSQNISTREVNKLISEYTESELSDVVLESRTVDNYDYLIVHLPDYVLQLNMQVAKAAGVDQAWSLLTSDTSDTPYRAKNGVFDPRRADWVYGDKQESITGYLDDAVATQYDANIECILYTPLTYLESASIDSLDIQTIPGFNGTDDATVLLSMTYDGYNYSMEHTINYGAPSAYTQRFEAYRLGYVGNFFGLKLRWTNTSRMAFATAKIGYG